MEKGSFCSKSEQNTTKSEYISARKQFPSTTKEVASESEIILMQSIHHNLMGPVILVRTIEIMTGINLVSNNFQLPRSHILIRLDYISRHKFLSLFSLVSVVEDSYIQKKCPNPHLQRRIAKDNHLTRPRDG